MRAAYITHAQCLKHDMGPWHPECPRRLTAIEDRLILAVADGAVARSPRGDDALWVAAAASTL